MGFEEVFSHVELYLMIARCCDGQAISRLTECCRLFSTGTLDPVYADLHSFFWPERSREGVDLVHQSHGARFRSSLGWCLRICHNQAAVLRLDGTGLLKLEDTLQRASMAAVIMVLVALRSGYWDSEVGGYTFVAGHDPKDYIVMEQTPSLDVILKCEAIQQIVKYCRKWDDIVDYSKFPTLSELSSTPSWPTQPAALPYDPLYRCHQHPGNITNDSWGVGVGKLAFTADYLVFCDGDPESRAWGIEYVIKSTCTELASGAGPYNEIKTLEFFSQTHPELLRSNVSNLRFNVDNNLFHIYESEEFGRDPEFDRDCFLEVAHCMLFLKSFGAKPQPESITDEVVNLYQTFRVHLDEDNAVLLDTWILNEEYARSGSIYTID